MGENVPAECDKYPNGVFYSGFLIISAEEKWKNFKNNMEDRNVKTLVLTVATQNLFAFMSMNWNKVIDLKYILK